MRKVVINCCYGGFSLSDEGVKRYFELKGYTPIPVKTEYSFQCKWRCEELPNFYCRDLERHDPVLVQVVKELGKKANGECANLVVVEVNGRYRINEYDGMESIEEEGAYSGWL